MKTGQDIVMISTSSAIVAATKVHDITVRCGEQEISSSTQGTWLEFIPGRKDWEISTSWLLLQQGFASQVLKAGNTYRVTIGDRNNVYDRVSGNVICTEVRVTATRGNLVQGSFRFRGNGELLAE